MTVSWRFGSFHPRILENPPHHQFNREVRFICWVCLLLCVVFGKLFTLPKVQQMALTSAWKTEMFQPSPEVKGL